MLSNSYNTGIDKSYATTNTTLTGGSLNGSYGYGRTREQQLTEKIVDTLVSCGFFEAITYSFESPSDMDLLRVAEDSPLRNQVKISNPLGDDTSVMRTTMLPSMLRIAARNSNRGVPAAKVFEVAYVYIPDEDPANLPEERKTLCGFSYDNTASDSKTIFYEVKGIIEEVTTILGIRSVSFEPLTDDPSFHPGRSAKLIVNGKCCGKFGVIYPEAAENFDAPSKSVFFEIECKALTSAAKTERVYKQLPKYPGIARDIAVMVDKSVPVGEIIKTCKSAGGKLLKEVEFFDVYEDSKLGADMKSVAVSLMYRDDSKTLTEADIKESYDKILERLAKNYNAKLR